jgi:bidirectional [NiFe] hydrogenase diaphorase subunit
MIKLTIDGKDISVASGLTILEAAGNNGIEIPTLCKHEGLSPLAHCRLCVVEVTQNGRKKVVTSCNYKVGQGMVVETKTDNIIAMRKTIVELLLGRSPSVPVINELAEQMGVDATAKRFLPGNDKCILCGLCVHVCNEYIGACAISFSGHGAEKLVSAPLSSSAGDCIGCGACVEICPARCISMTDVDEAKTCGYGEQEKIGPARLIRNWNARIPWKKCEKCGKHFPPPSPMGHLKKGEALPKKFFDICEKCQ